MSKSTKLSTAVTNSIESLELFEAIGTGRESLTSRQSSASTFVATETLIDRLSAREEFIREQTQCCLCGDSLEFDHVVESANAIVKEESRCPSCRIRLRSRNFRIH